MAQAKESTEEPLEKVKEKMRKAKILNKAANFGMRKGLGVVSLVEVFLVRAAIGQRLGEGIQDEGEQGKTDENIQPPSHSTSTSTQSPPSATTQAPISTSTTTIPMPTSPSVFAATSTTLPQVTTVLFPAIENVNIHNIESNYDQEDEQPMEQPLGGEKERNQPKDS